MSVFAISDLHLALSVDKPMDVFGSRWANYMERLESNWRAVVSQEDTVLMPGDISWATYLEDAVADFEFIDSLPGNKIISKGNHDYWWTTARKLELFKQEKKLTTINFLHNNSYRIDDVVVCGTRGCMMPEEDSLDEEDRKIYNRELQRLELSLKNAEIGEGDKLIVAMHYPVCNTKGVFSGFLDIMEKYNTNLCIYGHLHSYSLANAFEGVKNGIDFKLVSADHLEFKPLKLY
jgi:predicted phosphohydrolase